MHKNARKLNTFMRKMYVSKLANVEHLHMKNVSGALHRKHKIFRAYMGALTFTIFGLG